jgi:hypothetical protein
MNTGEILKAAEKFEALALGQRGASLKKKAAQELNDANLRRVVKSFYDEINQTGGLNSWEVREPAETSHPTSQPLWQVHLVLNSWFEASWDATLQSRLQGAFDPQREMYEFHRWFIDESGQVTQ